jgi:lysophospholipase L1-like esterase
MINRSGQNRHNFFAKYTIDVTRLDLEAEMLVHAIRILLFPVLVAQGAFVRWSALRLADPSGRRHGVSGQGPDLRLLIIGDSSAVGVGTSHQEEALLGQMRKRLLQTNTVYWSVDAETGATTADTIARLEGREPQKCDIVSVSLGVNDVTARVPLSEWLQHFSTLLELVDHKFQADVICVSGIPPIQYFPLLPQPLRWVLGAQAAQFDQALRELVANRAKCRFIEMDFEPDASKMSPDGFHPGPKIYSEWGRKVYRAIRRDIKQLGRT